MKAEPKYWYIFIPSAKLINTLYVNMCSCVAALFNWQLQSAGHQLFKPTFFTCSSGETCSRKTGNRGADSVSFGASFNTSVSLIDVGAKQEKFQETSICNIRTNSNRLWLLFRRMIKIYVFGTNWELSLILCYSVSTSFRAQDRKPTDTEHLLCVGPGPMFLGILCVELRMRGLCPSSSVCFIISL